MQARAVSLGCILVGLACLIGAIAQLCTGETWGAAGKGRVSRAQEPGQFWTLFAMRSILGPIALAGGIWGLAHGW